MVSVTWRSRPVGADLNFQSLLQSLLKVVGKEKNGGSGRSQMLRYGAAGPWRSMFIYNLNMQFQSKNSYFLFRLLQEHEQAITLSLTLGYADRIVRGVSIILFQSNTNNFRIFCWFGPQMAMRIKFRAPFFNHI